MSITWLDIWRAARVRSVPFSGESAGYLVFALCEETRGAPRALELSDVELVADGSVRALPAAPCAEALAEKQLRALLARLLEVASSPGPSLWRAAGRAAGGRVSGLAVELQKALIPFNRAAARRALLRLHRETERAVTDGRLGAPPDSDSEQDLLRLSPPPAKVSEPAPSVAPVVVAPVVAAPIVVPSPVPLAVAALVDLPPSDEPLRDALEQLTRPETIVSRRRAQLPSWPPPLPPIDHAAGPRTPRMGSMDVAIVAAAVPPVALSPRTRTPSPPPLPVFDDLTERVPEVSEFLASEDESPALVVGVHVPDSEDVAEQVCDEELVTRPLPVLAPPMPYAGEAAQPADVRELLKGFQVAEAIGETELRRELKALAGVDLTPGSAVDIVPR
jgi:hypothetical protein